MRYACAVLLYKQTRGDNISRWIDGYAALDLDSNDALNTVNPFEQGISPVG